MSVGRNYRVYHKHTEGAPYSLIVENSRVPDEFLLFESNVVASLRNKECEEFKKQYSKLMDGYGCLGVLQLQGTGGQLMQYLCMVTGCVSVGKIGDCDVLRITNAQFLPMWAPLPSGVQASLVLDERVAEIQKFLGSGTFYFSWAAREDSLIDLSVSAQRRRRGCGSDSRFFWNRTLHSHLRRYGIDTVEWLLRCICGGVEMKTVYVGHKTAKACLISRLSCERMGTRFNVRGVNDHGHVANFVETEQVVFYDDQVASFVQTRGSVPLFWEQPGVQVGSHKVKMCRGFEASAPAYDRHLKLMKSIYGRLSLVNLLGVKEGEKVLGQAFEAHHENSDHRDDTPYVAFDYHAMVRSSNRSHNLTVLWNRVKDQWEQCGFFHSKGAHVTRSQTGVIRTNCLDCLDRTNAVQAFVGLNTLLLQLRAMELADNFRSRFEEIYKHLWTTNGDQCSKIYAGTGALEGKSKVRDASRSVTRTIQNNFMDGSKQEAMDIFLLGTALNSDVHDRARALLPVSLLQGASWVSACPRVLSSVGERGKEMTAPSNIRIFCGTWNVNGGQRFNSVVYRRDQPLTDWLLDLSNKSAPNLVDVSCDIDSGRVDVFVVGLQEIVDLNATNIVSATSTNQKLWCEALKQAVSRDRKYILLHSVQLVGVCLFIYMRPQLAPFVREVATDIVKTGLGGAAGNKGGVAIRFILHSTSFCFVCSHFAAGQKEVADRNADYAEICKRISFPMGRGLFSHDYVFWLGDFNYRIDMSGEEVKRLVRDANMEPMIAADQLSVQRKAGAVFQDFREGPLTFAPTYKYDTYSNDYDTSEKCRTPAWTDRVLWWQRTDADESQLVYYGRAELKTSDHRPVGAIFDVKVRRVDEQRRARVFHEIVTQTGPPDATVLVSAPGRPPGHGFPEELMDAVLGKAAELGAYVLLVKFVGDDMWMIFKEGEMALTALSMDGSQIGQERISVRLRSPQWEEECERELKESTVTSRVEKEYDLLGDDAAPYDLDDEDNESATVAVAAVLETEAVRPSGPPKRPPPPTAKTPTGEPGTGIGLPTNVRRVSANTAQGAELLIAQLQGEQPVSPPEDDWLDFVQTRTVGASKFYAAPPTAERTEQLESPAIDISKDYAVSDAPLGPPPPPPPRPAPDEMVQPPVPPRPCPVISSSTPPPIPARRPPPLTN